MKNPEGRDGLPDRILFALSFLTRLPVPSRIHEGGLPSHLGALPLFVTGLLLGGILSFLSWVMGHLPFLATPLSPFLSALALMIAWTALTGGLHLDGVADMLESALVFASPEEKRRIRKDPRKGVYAIVGLNLLLLGKWTGILLATPGPVALFLAPLLARSILPIVFRGLSKGVPDHPEGLGALLVSGGNAEAALAAIFALLIIFLLSGVRGGADSLLVLGGVFFLGRWILKRSDGLSGDLAGFLIESGEVLFLLSMSA